jgi:hypothetical protein
MSGGAITEMGSADRAGWMRAIEAAVRRILGAGVAIAVRFTNSLTITQGSTATRALTVTGIASSTVPLFRVDASATTNGQVTDVDKNGHLAASSAAAPTIAAGAGAGTGPTVTVGAGSTDQSGTISVLTGTTPTGSNAIVCTVTFRTAYATSPRAVLITPANTATGNLARNQDGYVNTAGGGAGVTAFQLTSGLTALTASTTYVWHYFVF